MRAMSGPVVLAAAVIALGATAACGGAHSGPAPETSATQSDSGVVLELSGTSWRFAEAAGAPVPANIAATLAFSADGTVSGSTGCNRFTGRYDSSGENLAFSGLGFTKMMCPHDAMVVERSVQSVFDHTTRMTMSPGALELLGADGAVLAHLAPAA